MEATVTRALALAPDVVAVSGDLTQRARPREFVAARSFLDRLPGEHVVVPGNHDVPLYDLATRFLRPLSRYREHISTESFPIYEDDDLLVIGAASARGFTFSGGRLSREVAAHVGTLLESRRRPTARVKVLVCHHPIDLGGRRGRRGTLPGHIALPEVGDLGIDVVLTGHMHAAGITHRALPLAETEHGVLHIAAGTTTSTRTRKDEPNSFNFVRISPARVEVEKHVWNDAAAAFVPARIETFARRGGLWHPA